MVLPYSVVERKTESCYAWNIWVERSSKTARSMRNNNNITSKELGFKKKC